MNKSIRAALILIVLLSGIILGENGKTLAQSRAPQKLVSEAERISGDTFKFTAKTPKGATVYGVSKPTAKTLAAIDQGLTNLFSIAKKNNYDNRLRYSDYVIFVARADRTKDANGNYSPDFAIGAAQYAGTKYDQGGYIYAAGIVIGFNPCAFVIAEHNQQFNRVSEVVRYEGEHLILYHNDRELFKQTRDHSRGGGHPILN